MLVSVPPSRRQIGKERRELLDEGGIARALRRIAHEIVERNHGTEELALVGVRTGGLVLAERLVKLLAATPEAIKPALGAVDINLYRDDIFSGLPRPAIGTTELPFSIPGRTIVLVDDVLYTGRTVRAGLDAIMDYGRPRAVQLAVLVDRGHRELPIRPDFVGKNLPTSLTESVEVQLSDAGDQSDAVVLSAREPKTEGR